MTSLFMDTSALVKWYVTEKGSSRVQTLLAERESEIHLSQITLPEITAALSAKRRAPKGLDEAELGLVVKRFLQDCNEIFQLADVSREVINVAVQITQRRKIRGCDAIQLATVLKINQTLIEAELPPLKFVASDTDLLDAAIEEGLVVENPETK